MGLLERTKIGNPTGGAIAVYPIDSVGIVCNSVRAAAAADQGVERVADEGDVGDAADETALRCLVGWKTVDDGGACAAAIHP